VSVVGFDHDALERLRHDRLPGLGSHVWEPAQVPDIRRRDHDVIRRAAEQRRLGRFDAAYANPPNSRTGVRQVVLSGPTPGGVAPGIG